MKYITRLILAAFAMLVLPLLALAQDDGPNITLFTNVDVYDGMSDRLSLGTDVLVEGNLIKQVAKDIDAPAGAVVIDGKGLTIVPGLIDSHTHLQGVVGLSALEFLPEQEISARMVPIAEDMLMRGFYDGS